MPSAAGHRRLLKKIENLNETVALSFISQEILNPTSCQLCNGCGAVGEEVDQMFSDLVQEWIAVSDAEDDSSSVGPEMHEQQQSTVSEMPCWMKSAINWAGAIAQWRQGDHCRLGNALVPEYCSDEELFRSWILRNLKADVQALRPLANCTSLLQTESLWIDCWSPEVLEKWIDSTHSIMCLD